MSSPTQTPSRFALAASALNGIRRAFGKNIAEATLPHGSDLAGRGSTVGTVLAEVAAGLEIAGNILKPHMAKRADDSTYIGSAYNDAVSSLFNNVHAAQAGIMRVARSAGRELFGGTAEASTTPVVRVDTRNLPTSPIPRSY